MNLPSLRFALVAGMALPFVLATATLAQEAVPPAAPALADAPGPQHHRDPAAMRAHMADHLRAALQLQPGQDAALSAYLDALKPPGDRRDGLHQDYAAMEHLPTPQRLDRLMAHLDEMHARMAARIAATKQFYAQLTPSQQKAFDDLAPMMMRHFGHQGMEGPNGLRHGGFDHEGGPHPMGPGGAPQG